jgi:hypothetical protein
MANQRKEQSEGSSRVADEGNKTQGDDLEEIIPGKGGRERVRRGAETFDIEGERVSRVAGGRRNKRDDADGDVESGSSRSRGAETFDIEGERVSRVAGGRRNKRDDGDVESEGGRGAETFDIEGDMQRPMRDDDSDDDDASEPSNKSGAV